MGKIGRVALEDGGAQDTPILWLYFRLTERQRTQLI
jgi:hypothetical protein